jgi:membrane protease YdiL (CAAX protease family)
MKKAVAPLIQQGWLRALLYLVIVVSVFFGYSQIGSAIFRNLVTGESVGLANSFTQLLITYSILSATFFLITWLFKKFIDREPFKALGFQWTGFQMDALVGFLTGPALLGIGTIILAVGGYLTFINFRFNGLSLLVEALFMLIVAFTEETLFRGYVLNNLLKSTNKWVALTITSVLFAAVHITNPGVSVIAIINIFVAGFLFGINYIYTRNLWFAVLFHFSWNFFQGPVFGYEVSGLDMQSVLEQTLSGPALLTGGKFGFEESLLCPVLTGCAAIVYGFAFYKKYRSTGEQLIEPEGGRVANTNY